MKFKQILTLSVVSVTLSATIGCSGMHKTFRATNDFWESVGLGDSRTDVIKNEFMTAFDGMSYEYINEFFKGYVYRDEISYNNNPLLNQYILSVPNDCNLLLNFDDENKFYKLEPIYGDKHCSGGSVKNSFKDAVNASVNRVPVGECKIVKTAIQKYLKAGGRDITLEELKKMNEDDSFVIVPKAQNSSSSTAKLEMSDVKEELSGISAQLKEQARASGAEGTVDSILDNAAAPYKKNGLMHVCSTVNPEKKGLVVGATDDGKFRIAVDNADEIFSDVPENFVPCK